MLNYGRELSKFKFVVSSPMQSCWNYLYKYLYHRELSKFKFVVSTPMQSCWIDRPTDRRTTGKGRKKFRVSQ
jgi:hypothetical protein